MERRRSMRAWTGAVAALLSAALLCGSAAIAAGPVCPALARLKPRNGWSSLDHNNCELCLFNRVRIGPGGRLSWNGAPIDEAKLRTYLRLTRAMTPQPVTLIRAEPGADCATIGRISRMIEVETPCPGRFCPYGIDRKRP